MNLALYLIAAGAHWVLYTMLLISILPVPESDAAQTAALTLILSLTGFGALFWTWVNFWVLNILALLCAVAAFAVNVGAFSLAWICARLQESMDGLSPLE